MIFRFVSAAVLVIGLIACGGQSRDQMMQQGQELEKQGNQKGAIVVYKNLLEKYPGDVPATLALVSAYIDTGKADLADAELVKALPKLSDSIEAKVLSAKVANSLGKPERALETLAPLLGAPNPPGEAFEQAGNALLLQQKFPEAQKAYEKAVGISGNLLKARLGLAESLLQLKEPAKAREQVDTVLAAAPQDRAALYMLLQMQMLADDEEGVLSTYGRIAKANPSDLKARYSEAFIRLGKKQDKQFAQSVAQSILSQYPASPEGMKLQGLLSLADKDYQKALEYFLKAQTKRQDLDTSAFLAQTYVGLGNLETAVSHIQAALSQNPNLLGLRRMLATIYLRQNRLDEALAEARKSFDTAPDDVAGQRLLAETLMASRDYEKGLEIFSMMADKEVQQPLVYSKQGMLLAMKGDAAGAEEAFRKGVEMGGQQLEPRIYLASYLMGKNRIDEAVEILGAGPAQGPQRALSLNAMAKMRLMQRKLPESVELLEQAKAADPTLMLTYYNLASIDMASGKVDKAAADFEAALAVNPNDARALMGAAGGYEALGDMAKAQGYFERAAKADPARAALTLAGFYVRRSDNAKAMLVVDDLIAKQPKDIPAWLFKSRLHAMAKEQDKVLAALSSVETIDQRTGLLEKAKYHLSVNEPAQAVEIATRVRDLKPGSAAYAMPLAEVQSLTGDLDAARATLRAALKEEPDSIQALSTLGQFEARKGNTAEALALVDTAMEKGMAPGAGRALKGTILLQKGDAKAAAGEYELALKANDRQALALNNLAMIYADDEANKGKALELAVRAFSVEPNNPSVMDTLGYALLKNGRGKDAVTLLEKADKLMPGNQSVKQHLAMAREAAGAEKQ